MEKNTFATSAYIATSPESAFDYLCSLKNLDEWTLYSRMKEQIDEDTWVGTASGYHKNLYYHVKRLEHPRFYGIEWHCGLEYEKYYQVYPVLLFPSDYIEPGTDEKGVYFHWLSFVDPKRQTQMIMQGIHAVHTSECRSLKANLERKAGLNSAAKGRYFIDTDTIYVDAPVEMGVEFLSDLRLMDDWAHLLHADGEITAHSGEFRDEYNQKVKVTLEVKPVNKWYLLEQEFFYPDQGFYQRSPMMLIPASHAFGDPEASGFVLHRITFWRSGESLPHGKLQIEDFGAESMNIKRLVEAKAGNLESFNRGMSYLPKS
ncbi:MAG: scytonemin biosynthesis cyclase/decarboxylase ScyC [Rhizonema sp. NSF051]|nr:scytonemin biosynthesis cyclase/decarboxylase ScyC [Rhizonema sp. NSF051]